MRSIRMLAVVTAAVVLGSACGDGGGTPPPDNRAPVAGFSEVCTQLSCVFTDASTDPDGNTTITTRSWSFGDGTPVIAVTSPTHVYAAAGTYAVVLTVTDNGGLNNSLSKNVVVTAAPPPPPPVNIPPTASFTSSCTGNSCTFTSTSTDGDGTIASYAWNFGEPASATNTSAEQNPAHTYAAVTQQTVFTVTLTVTDDDGAASAAATGTVTIQPPAAQTCTTTTDAAGDPVVDCTLDITARATVKITLTSVSCELGGSGISIRPPVGPKQVFGNVCFRAVPEEFTVTDATGAPRVIEAGTQMPIRFTQGTDTPVPGAPAGTLQGTYPNWTIKIDDGGNQGGAGEPDFTDVILTIEATPVP